MLFTSFNGVLFVKAGFEIALRVVSDTFCCCCCCCLFCFVLFVFLQTVLMVQLTVQVPRDWKRVRFHGGSL